MTGVLSIPFISCRLNRINWNNETVYYYEMMVDMRFYC